MFNPSKTIRTIMVDDESHAINLMKKVLNLFPNNIELLGEAHDLPSAVQLINETKPDLVFLDIDMPNYSGLQINDFFGSNKLFKTVFVTAHSKYSIEALRQQAFDYLLKPLDINDLKKCIDRINLALEEQKTNSIKEINFENEGKLMLNSHQGIVYLDIENIFFIEASGMYSIVHHADEPIIVSKPLKEFEFLEGKGFFRTHRSYIVNTKKIVRFYKVETNEIELENGKKLSLSRSKKEEFIQFMSDKYSI